MHKNRFDKLKSIDFSNKIIIIKGNNQIHELKGIESLTAIEVILEKYAFSLIN